MRMQSIPGLPLPHIYRRPGGEAKWHTAQKDGDYVCEFDEEGKQVYKSFANEMAQIMNDMWESGVGYQGNNVSKDKRNMIRYIYIFT